jgi:glycopeptide antibiotics resistance protein
MVTFVKNHHFIPAWVFAGVMFVGCSVPVDKISIISESHPILSVVLSDSFLHFCMFGLLVWLICYGSYKSSGSRIPYMKYFFLAISYGLGIEIWQAVLPYRSFSIFDLVFDLLGISVAIIVSKSR